MKEEFKELYKLIIHSNNEDKMRVLGSVTKDMMCQLIDNNPQQAREYLNMLQSVKWNNYVTVKEAEQIVSNMKPNVKWDWNYWNRMIVDIDGRYEEEPYYNSYALYTTMSMIMSDSGKTLLNLGMDERELFKLIYHLALDKLKDEDNMFNIRSYFKL